MTPDNDAGAVIWITGFSAAGKTTVGRVVTQRLLEAGLPALFLDGDQLRSMFAHRWGYSREDRVELACTYFKLCSHLSKQGAVVVISAVAMLDEAQEWFRRNVDNGLEVYLRVPLEERMARDQRTKQVYARGMSSMQDYTEPTQAALTIDNFGGNSVEATAATIVHAFQARRGRTSVDYGRESHWSGFYKSHKRVAPPSPFALDSRRLMQPGERLLELGCGNGRDAVYFDGEGLRVTAIDKSAEAIEACRANAPGREIVYLCADAAEVAGRVDGRFDVVYSRFSLHAMTRIEEEGALQASHALLVTGGKLLVECRSINDPLSREGDVLSPTERIAGHYRRFIVLEELRQKLQRIGFVIDEAVESTGLARHGDEDPVVIRIAAPHG
jgi:bifunctional enzyme CysN/CysC